MEIHFELVFLKHKVENKNFCFDSSSSDRWNFRSLFLIFQGARTAFLRNRLECKAVDFQWLDLAGRVIILIMAFLRSFAKSVGPVKPVTEACEAGGIVGPHEGGFWRRSQLRRLRSPPCILVRSIMERTILVLVTDWWTLLKGNSERERCDVFRKMELFRAVLKAVRACDFNMTRELPDLFENAVLWTAAACRVPPKHGKRYRKRDR